MSSLMYIASDYPLAERPNPHEQMMSVNQALAAGVKNISAFLLADSFDKNKPDVILVADREVNINVDTGIIEDGDFDDDFAVWLRDKQKSMGTNKKYCAEFEWIRYTPGRAKMFISYLKDQLKNTTEIELWHIWQDNEPHHKINLQIISIDNLKPEDIAALEKTDIFTQPATDYCYIITH